MCEFLGIYIDNILNWKTHIRELTSILSPLTYLLRRLTLISPSSVVKSAYYGLFQSRISYGLMFWGNSTNVEQVFKMQKRAIRIISGRKALDSCRPLFKELNILPLPGLYIYIYISVCLFCKKKYF